MYEKKELSIGIEDFKTIIDCNYYFVDKSLLLHDLMHRFGKVTLFTRPRRFGKSLNMSMIRCFFEKSKEDNAYLFKDLAIAQAGEQYMKHQGKYPVISITLKDIEASDYETAFALFKAVIADEFRRHREILKSSELLDIDKEEFLNICNQKASAVSYIRSLKFLSDRLCEVYGKKVIILIDEYDVPLQSAYFNRYYDKMVELIRSVFSSVLKTNTQIAFAVLTGCLRISKESIFTGLNNPDVYSVTDTEFSDAFGFTESEVKSMLEYYQLTDRFEEIREWYDGYLFGRTEIYNPWSVLKYIQKALADAHIKADAYWLNTSSNSIIHELIAKSNVTVRKEIERLTNGESLEKQLFSDITYANMDVNHEHIWSFLLYTGYLKAVRIFKKGKYIFFEGKIPNQEVETIYEETFRQWFDTLIQEADKSRFFQAVLNGDTTVFEEEVNRFMLNSISYHDGYENFYHGFLAGLLKYSERFLVESNREAGTGRSDIVITDLLKRETAVIIEIKAAKEEKEMDERCDEALQQIEDRKYAHALTQKGYRKILKYGIAFYGKSCKVMM